MARFQQMNKYIQDTMLQLVDNQNLCKLLIYASGDAISKPDIKDTTSLLFDRIYPFPKIPETSSTAGSYISVILDSFRLGNDNSGTKEGILMFNVIVHNDQWKLNDGMLRPYSILNEIDEMFNNNRIVGIKKMQFDRAKYLYINEQYSGYQVSYQITSVN